ncbi:hypothetical protein RBI22_20435 [Alcaligenaceae bacterium C4P045]|nr:hypothetical protein [Alcaligenaceae bacterium C4P045]
MIHNKRQFFISGLTLLLVIAAAMIASRFFGERGQPPLASAQEQLSCGSEQYSEYNKNMVLSGELTIGRQPPTGTRQQQQAMVDAFGALTLPKDKTVIAAGYVKTGKVYTKVCQNEKCTTSEMAEPEQACLAENWDGCQYLAMQFREKQYCFLTPSDQ